MNPSNSAFETLALANLHCTKNEPFHKGFLQ